MKCNQSTTTASLTLTPPGLRPCGSCWHTHSVDILWSCSGVLSAESNYRSDILKRVVRSQLPSRWETHVLHSLCWVMRSRTFRRPFLWKHRTGWTTDLQSARSKCISNNLQQTPCLQGLIRNFDDPMGSLRAERAAITGLQLMLTKLCEWKLSHRTESTATRTGSTTYPRSLYTSMVGGVQEGAGILIWICIFPNTVKQVNMWDMNEDYWH